MSDARKFEAGQVWGDGICGWKLRGRVDGTPGTWEATCVSSSVDTVQEGDRGHIREAWHWFKLHVSPEATHEARIRAEAAAERTREIATWMKSLAAAARGHRDRMAHIPASWRSFDDWANRLEVLAEEMEQEFAALPQPGGDK